jgi:hypothetical protein
MKAVRKAGRASLGRGPRIAVRTAYRKAAVRGELKLTLDHDTNDGKMWSEMDVADLRTCLEAGSTLEEAAGFLRRSSTAGDVRAKADELGLTYRSSKAELGKRDK